MNKTLTPTELAAKLVEYQQALDDQEAGRKMLAEADQKVRRLESEIGPHPLIKALLHNANGKNGTPELALVEKGRRYQHPHRPVRRTVWEPQAIEYLKGIRVAAPAAALARHFGVSSNAMMIRLNELAKDGLIVRHEATDDRCITYQAHAPVLAAAQ